jgi:hypothetical protein
VTSSSSVMARPWRRVDLVTIRPAGGHSTTERPERGGRAFLVKCSSSRTSFKPQHLGASDEPRSRQGHARGAGDRAGEPGRHHRL